MKPKQILFKNKSMIAFILGAIFFAGCKKEADFTPPENNLLETTTETTTDAATTAAARSNLVFDIGFEGSNPFDENKVYKQGCCSYSITQSNTVAREGSSSFRAEVRASDGSTSNGYRAELITGGYTATSEAWYGYSTYFQNWNAFSGGEHVVQWHPNNGTGSAELSLQTASNKFDVVRSINGTNYHQQGTLKSIVSNKWYDFVWHIKWSTGNSGLIELWIDGQKYFSFTGRTMSSSIPYFKLGINRWNMGNSSRILYYDNLRIGNASATYNDVAPGDAGGSTTTPPDDDDPTTPPSGTNKPPVVNAGPDQTITTSTITLRGSASDPDGSIASYKWSKVSGIGAYSDRIDQPTVYVTGLQSGTYVIRLTVTDNKGATASDDVKVTVNLSGGGGGGGSTPPPTDPPPTNPPPTNPPPSGGGNYGTLTFQTGYDNASDINTNQGMYNSISHSIFKSGTGSFRSEVRGNQASQSSGYRSEMQYNNSSANPVEGVIAYDVYYENWKAVSGGGHSIQWHPNSSSGSAVLSLQNYGGRFDVVRSINGMNTHQSGSLMSVTANKWYNFRWEVRWSTGSDGYIRLYIDNTLYYSYTGRTTDGNGTPYLKVGQNRWNMSASQNTIVYYDNLKIYKK